MTGHLSQDALADHLADGSSSEASSHLQSCSQCQHRLDRLAQDSAAVSRLLAAEPAPAMPADVFARITDALRAEPVDRTQPDAPAVPTTGPDELTAARRRRHARLARFGRPAAVVAAAAAVVVAGGIGFSALTNSGSSDGASVADGPMATATTDSGTAGADNGPAGHAAAGATRTTALHTATFAHDVRALLAADARSSATHAPSGKPDLTRPGGGGDNSVMSSSAQTCIRAALQGTPLAHGATSEPKQVTLDGRRARLVITTGKAGHRTAVAIRGCGGNNPRIVAKAGL